MARILISEPDDAVRRLLQRMVTLLGHEPLRTDSPTEQLANADVLIIEPAAPNGALLAQAASIADPSLPLICSSVTEPPPELAKLGVDFAYCLVKPFTLQDFDVALQEALELSEHPQTSSGLDSS